MSKRPTDSHPPLHHTQNVQSPDPVETGYLQLMCGGGKRRCNVCKVYRSWLQRRNGATVFLQLATRKRDATVPRGSAAQAKNHPRVQCCRASFSVHFWLGAIGWLEARSVKFGKVSILVTSPLVAGERRWESLRMTKLLLLGCVRKYAFSTSSKPHTGCTFRRAFPAAFGATCLSGVNLVLVPSITRGGRLLQETMTKLEHLHSLLCCRWMNLLAF